MAVILHRDVASSDFNPVVVAAVAAPVVLLIALVFIIVLLIRALSKHKRLLLDLEHRGIELGTPSVGEIGLSIPPRPRNVLRKSTFLSYGTVGGWGSLASREDIAGHPSMTDIPGTDSPRGGRKRNTSSRLSWPFSRRIGIRRTVRPNRNLISRLSDIIESPRSQGKTPTSNSPALASGLADTLNAGARKPSPLAQEYRPHRNQTASKRPITIQLVTQPGVQPSPPQPFSPDDVTAGSSRSLDVDKRSRSKSSASVPANPDSKRTQRPQMHSRSVSLTSQCAGLAPNGPVPPLPLAVSVANRNSRPPKQMDRSASRQSNSSLESAGSSILITSPLMNRSASARSHEGADRDLRRSLVMGPRPLQDRPDGNFHQRPPLTRGYSSLRSSVARYSTESYASQRLSRASSVDSSLTNSNRLSVGHLKTAETIQLSRLSSSSSLKNKSMSVQAVHTPRRNSRSQVSAFGSPAERRKTSALRDVSTTQAGPSRQESISSTRPSSTRSSNGNPFQWDPSPMQSGKTAKPSALKGSPTARKGHRRQNCVRISLAPTYLGPASVASSPSRMNGIIEESPETNSDRISPSLSGTGFSNTRPLPRPRSASIFAPDVPLNPTLLRASLAPSSPTLSLVDYSCEGTREPNPIDEHLHRNSARYSTASSALEIPSFPSPCYEVDDRNPALAPDLVLTRPSTDRDREDTPSSRVWDRPPTPHLPVPNEQCDVFADTDAGAVRLDEYDETFATPLEVPPSIANSERSPLVPMSPPTSPKSQPMRAPSIFVPAAQSTDPSASSDPVKQATTATIAPLSDSQDPTSPRGPCMEPAQDLRKSVAQLRRMNSEATDQHRADRRYLKLGREASPALPGSESFASLFGMQNNHSESTSPTPRSSLVIPGLGLLHRKADSPTLGAGSPGPAREPSPEVENQQNSSSKKRDRPSSTGSTSSSVWEEGEKFWERLKKPSPEEEEQRLREEFRKHRRRSGTRSPKRLSEMRKSAVLMPLSENVNAGPAGLVTPRVKGLQGGDGGGNGACVSGTPGSLYDQDGFLRT